MVSGLAFVEDALEVERDTICGPRYRHDMRRRARGHAAHPSSGPLPRRSATVHFLLTREFAVGVHREVFGYVLLAVHGSPCLYTQVWPI